MKESPHRRERVLRMLEDWASTVPNVKSRLSLTEHFKKSRLLLIEQSTTCPKRLRYPWDEETASTVFYHKMEQSLKEKGNSTKGNSTAIEQSQGQSLEKKGKSTEVDLRHSFVPKAYAFIFLLLFLYMIFAAKGWSVSSSPAEASREEEEKETQQINALHQAQQENSTAL